MIEHTHTTTYPLSFYLKKKKKSGNETIFLFLGVLDSNKLKFPTDCSLFSLLFKI